MLLSRREWLYLLSLLIPFVVYSLALKALMVSSQDFKFGRLSSTLWIYVMWSDVFFILGYALLWIGLFAAARRGPLRWGVVVLFHATTILVVTVKTFAYQYFQETGTTLDYTIIALWLPRVDEIMPILLDGVPLSAWVLLVAVLFYAAWGPWLVTRFVVRWRRWMVRPSLAERPEKISVFGPLVPCLLALGFVSLSLQGRFDPVIEFLQLSGSEEIWQISKPLAKDQFVNVIVTAAEEMRHEEPPDVAADLVPENSPSASLAPTGSEQRNVALILLESTRAQSVTPYNKDLETTPFLDQLAKSSLVAERAYGSVPFTTKANVATHCGIFPYPVQLAFGLIPEAEKGGIPARCLPDLLKEQGYSTAYFMSAQKKQENWENLINNFGYAELYSRESMDEEGFEKVGGGAREDDIMLKPSEEWLTEQKESGKTFLATYMTSSPHHPYYVPKRYGEERFAEDEQLNNYLNAIRYQDFFLKNLFDQYKELGLYDDTVFVILGDHGEGFREHGIYSHGNVLYDESLKIPTLIHDPKRFENGARVTAPVNQLDILPSVADLLGYKIEGGVYQGSSILGPLPEDRALMFSCWEAGRCLASVKGTEKYIYYYDAQPEELFDLSEDPLEKHNLADDRGKEVEERRNELLAWRSKIDAFYRGPQRREE